MTLMQMNKTKELLDTGWTVVKQKGPVKPGTTAIFKHPETNDLIRIAGDGTHIPVSNEEIKT